MHFMDGTYIREPRDKRVCEYVGSINYKIYKLYKSNEKQLARAAAAAAAAAAEDDADAIHVFAFSTPRSSSSGCMH